MTESREQQGYQPRSAVVFDVDEAVDVFVAESLRRMKDFTDALTGRADVAIWATRYPADDLEDA